TLNALTGLLAAAADELGYKDYDYTDRSGERTVTQGQKVRVSSSYLVAEVDLDTADENTPINIIRGDLVSKGGQLYRYVGPVDGAAIIDLATLEAGLLLGTDWEIVSA